ncbi:MAG: TetR family transcriptional regulator [Mycobacterium sp.]
MPESLTLSERKRVANRERIAAAAAALVAQNGLAGATVEQISEEAEVGRATFFRYFSSKEAAVAEGISRQWLDRIAGAVAAQPVELSAPEAVIAAFSSLAEGFAEIDAQVRDLALLTRKAPALSAWMLKVYVGYENAIADLVTSRFPGIAPDDPRPRLLGALAMASVRIALDDWLDHGGSLPDRVHTALTAYLE